MICMLTVSMSALLAALVLGTLLDGPNANRKSIREMTMLNSNLPFA
jgi:hypothetical protein